MHDLGFQQRRQYESFQRSQLEAHQLDALNRQFETILPDNRFYADKLNGVTLPLQSLEQFRELPFTRKDELQQADGFAANRTWPLDRYTRFHRTSGTHGRPMIVVDP